MNLRIAILTAVLLTSTASIGEETFESVRDEFRRGVAALSTVEDSSFADLTAELTKLAEATFGAHPELVRKEAERRYQALPDYPAADLDGWVERASWDLTGISGTGEMWAMFAWNPERLARWAKSALLERQLDPEAFRQRAFLNAFVSDEVYRLGEGEHSDLVVESLGELFVIDVEPAAAGVGLPSAIRWLQRK